VDRDMNVDMDIDMVVDIDMDMGKFFYIEYWTAPILG
jgi:hypothetical protein